MKTALTISTIAIFSLSVLAASTRSRLASVATDYIPVEEAVPLPEGVVAVEYLESTGKQFIDTGIIPQTGDTYRGTIGRNATASDWSFWIMGCRYYTYFFGIRQAPNSNIMNINLNSSNHVELGVIGSEVLPFVFSDGYFSYNGVSASSSVLVGEMPMPICLFGVRGEYQYGVANQLRADVRMGAFSVERNGEVILDLVAVRVEDEDGIWIGCFYDLVSQTFFCRQGNVPFIIGPDL